MAHPIQLTEPHTGRVVFGYHGFSWTTLFFGPFPALFRGHSVGFLGIFAGILCTAGVATLIFPFFYNKWHFNWLLGKGYRAAGMGAAAGAAASSQNIIHVAIGNTQPESAVALPVDKPVSAQPTSP